MIISKNHFSVLISLTIITIVATYFGKWFALQQLQAVTTLTAAWESYPKVYLYITATKCIFTILLIFGFSCLTLNFISRQKLPLLWISISFLPLLLTSHQVPLKVIAATVLSLQALGLLSVWRRSDYRHFVVKYGVDALALLVLFLLHLLITSEYSPLHINKALFTMASEEIPVEAPLYKGYSLAKQFVFSTFDYSEWAAVINPPITLASPFSQMITLVFDLPSFDPISFHKILLSLGFLLIVGGAFGCYLFLKYVCRIHSLLAWLGGGIMFFSVAPYLSLMINADGGIFLATYATLPLILLFLTLACEKLSYTLAAWAGAAMASQFFLFSPHPEGVIYTVLCSGLYGIGLVLFSPFGKPRQRFMLITVAFVSFALLAAYVVVPMFIDQWSGNMYTFAHTSDLEANKPLGLKYLFLLKFFVPLSMLFLLYRRNLYPAYLPALFFCLTMNLLYFATTNIKFVNLLVNTLHVGIHIWAPCRMQLFTVLSLFFVFLMGLDGFVRFTFNGIMHICARLPERYVDNIKYVSYLLFKAQGKHNEQA